MQSIDLCDEIDIEISKDESIAVLSDKDIDCKPENNIVYKAAKFFFEYTGIKNPGIKIGIKKNIPISAGLAGGSTDGAATLSALNFMFNANLSNSELMDLGAKVGSDIPFCITGGTAHATGSGVSLKSIDNLKDCFIVVVKPPISVSTKEAYDRSDSIANKSIHNFDSLINGIKNNDLSMICKNLFNRFEEVISEEIVFLIKENLCDLGARGALMSGSGPTVFGIFENERTALNCANKMKCTYPQSFYCRPLNQGAYVKAQD
jgi:4-diphosphocytidyl-2-C-methyl-D-erythritol kinase